MINGLLEKGKRIMIVDDDNHCTYTIKIVLERYGFKVYSYNNAYLALDAYKSNFYDLVIFDIILPEMLANDFIRKPIENQSLVQKN